MGFNFKQSAQNTNSNSFLQVGREKMQWAQVDGQPVTIIAIDRNEGPMVDQKGNIVTDEDGVILMTPYTTVLLSEYPDKFFGGFGALDRIVEAWLDNFDSIADLNEELASFGGVKIQTHMQMRNGKNSRKVDIL